MKNLLTGTLILFFTTFLLQDSKAQEESRIKISLSISLNGKASTVMLNSVATSFSRYYDDPLPVPTEVKGSDSTATKTNLSSTTAKSGVFYLNLDAKNLPDEALKLMAGRKSTFDGTITISDSFGKLPTRTIKFFKASLYSFSDQYSSAYYGDSVGNNVALSLGCSSISINGIMIEQ